MRRTTLKLTRLEDRTVPTATVSAVRVNEGAVQRSEVRSITVDFSQPVTFTMPSNPASAFEVRDIMTGTQVGLAAQVGRNALGGTEVRLTFSGAGTDPISAENGGQPSLADGRYTLTVVADAIQSADGTPLDGSGDGTPGDDWHSVPDTMNNKQLGLYRLFGDVDGDGIVNANDLAQFQAAVGTTTGQAAYLEYLDADNNGVVNSQDFAQFRTRYNTNVFTIRPFQSFYVDPATGNDSNNGLTEATAWKTWNRLVAAVKDGTIQGGAWVTSAGLPADLSTLQTPADKEAWYTAYTQGDRIVTGAHIYLNTTQAPLQITQELYLPSGCEITSATAQPARLEIETPVPATEQWFRPDPVNDPDIYETTGTDYLRSALYEWHNGWAQEVPIYAPTLAQAMPQLETYHGSFWTDAAGHMYTHPLDGGNPNTDGVAREYTPGWVGTAGGDRAVSLIGGLAYNLSGDGGFGYDPTTGQVTGLVGIGVAEWDSLSVIDSCAWAHAGKHTFEASGNLGTGFAVFRKDVASEGPAATFVGYWSHFVDYTSYSGTGSIMTIYDGCSTPNAQANLNAPGGTDANPTVQVFLAHSNDATPSMAERIFENCDFTGALYLGSSETVLAIVRDCVLAGSVESYTRNDIVQRCSMGFRMPGFTGNATVTDCIMVGGSFIGEQPNVAGSITFDRCTFDLTKETSPYAGAWLRVGPLALTIKNSVVLDVESLGIGLIYGVSDGDTVSLDHDLFQGSTGFRMLRAYDNADAANYTYADVLSGAVDGVTITDTQFVAGAGLDPNTYAPAPTSPAVGQAAPEYNVTDYTGRTFPVRDTIGALELGIIPRPHLWLVPVGAVEPSPSLLSPADVSDP